MNDFTFGNRIYELRNKKGLSQKELGKLVGVSDKAVSKWETGAAKPRAEKLAKLSEVFGVPLGALFSAEPDGDPKSDAGARDGEIDFAIGLLSREYKTTKKLLIASVVCYFAAPLLMLLFLAVGQFSGGEIKGAAAAIFVGLFLLHFLAEAAVIIFFLLLVKRKRILYASFPQRQEAIFKRTHAIPPAKKTGKLGLIVLCGVVFLFLDVAAVLYAVEVIEGSFTGIFVGAGALCFGIFNLIFVKVQSKRVDRNMEKGEYACAIATAKFMLEVWLPDGRSMVSEALRLRIALASFALGDDETFLEYSNELATRPFLPAKSYCRCLYLLSSGDKEGFCQEYREVFLPLKELREKRVQAAVEFYGEPLALFDALVRNGDETAREKLLKTVKSPRTKALASNL